MKRTSGCRCSQRCQLCSGSAVVRFNPKEDARSTCGSSGTSQDGLENPAKRYMAVTFDVAHTCDAGVVCAACFASLCTKEHTQCSRCTACHNCNKKMPKGAQCKNYSTFKHNHHRNCSSCNLLKNLNLIKRTCQSVQTPKRCSQSVAAKVMCLCEMCCVL